MCADVISFLIFLVVSFKFCEIVSEMLIIRCLYF